MCVLRAGPGAATPNVFDPEVCYEQCMADATCILAVHDGVNNECTKRTRETRVAMLVDQ